MSSDHMIHCFSFVLRQASYNVGSAFLVRGWMHLGGGLSDHNLSQSHE